MCSRGHSPYWGVETGENRLPWSDSRVWAPVGGGATDGPSPRFVTHHSDGRTSSRRHACPIDERNQLDGGADRHDLMLGTDADRARRAALFGIGQADHSNPRDGRRRPIGDHGHVVAVPGHALALRVDDRDPSSIAIQQPAESRSKQPWSHRDEHLEWWLQ